MAELHLQRPIAPAANGPRVIPAAIPGSQPLGALRNTLQTLRSSLKARKRLLDTREVALVAREREMMRVQIARDQDLNDREQVLELLTPDLEARETTIRTFTREYICTALYAAIGYLENSALPAARTPLIAFASVLKRNAHFVAWEAGGKPEDFGDERANLLLARNKIYELMQFFEMMFDAGVKVERAALPDAMAVVEMVSTEAMQHGF